MATMTVRSLDDDLKRRSGADSRAPSPKVWGLGRPGDSGQALTMVKRPRQEPGDSAGGPRYIPTEVRVVCRMPNGKSP